MFELARGVSPRPAATVRYAAAIGCVAAATLLRAGLDGVADTIQPFGTYYPAILLSAVVGGLLPGLLAVVLSALAAWYLFLPIPDSLATPDAATAVNLGLFIASSLCLVGLAEAFLRARSERRTSTILFETLESNSLDGLVVLKAVRDADGSIVDFEWRRANRRALQLLGRGPGSIVGKRLLDVFPTAKHDPNAFSRFVQVVESGEPSERDVRYEAAGSTGWFSSSATKIGDGVAVIFRDITGRKRAEKRQDLMLRELDHRIKNIVATTLALVHQTARNTKSIVQYRDDLAARVDALGRAHALINGEPGSNHFLESIVATTLAPYTAVNPDRVQIDGPVVALSPKTVVKFHMVLHELATNAVKHGALSVPNGSVRISWTATGDPASPEVRLKWRERDGPRVAPPTQSGFGMRLLRRGLGNDAQVSVLFKPSGLDCRLSFNAAGDESMAARGAAGDSPEAIAELEPAQRRRVVEQARVLDDDNQAVIATDADGAIVYWSHVAERLYGWRAAEVLERNILDVTPTDASRELAASIMARLKAGESWHGDFQAKHKDGRWLAVQVTDTAVRDRDGQIIGIVGFSQEVGDRKAA